MARPPNPGTDEADRHVSPVEDETLDHEENEAPAHDEDAHEEDEPPLTDAQRAVRERRRMRQESFGMFITKRRQELGMSQGQAAMQAGLTRNTLGRLERGHVNTLDVRTIFDLARVLGYAPLMLMTLWWPEASTLADPVAEDEGNQHLSVELRPPRAILDSLERIEHRLESQDASAAPASAGEIRQLSRLIQQLSVRLRQLETSHKEQADALADLSLTLSEAVAAQSS